MVSPHIPTLDGKVWSTQEDHYVIRSMSPPANGRIWPGQDPAAGRSVAYVMANRPQPHVYQLGFSAPHIGCARSTKGPVRIGRHHRSVASAPRPGRRANRLLFGRIRRQCHRHVRSQTETIKECEACRRRGAAPYTWSSPSAARPGGLDADYHVRSARPKTGEVVE